MGTPSTVFQSGQGLVHSALGGLNRHAAAPDREGQPLLRAWRAERALLAGGNNITAYVICAGHSWVEGRTWVDYLRTYLQSRYGNAGFGYVNFAGSQEGGGIEVYSTGTWTEKNGNSDPTVEGVDLYSVNSSDISTPATKTVTSQGPQAPCTEMLIHYYCRTGGGSFTYEVDTGHVTTNGTIVNWAAGGCGLQFTAGMAGQPITINGVSYTVATVPSNILLTLTTSAGVQSSPVTFYVAGGIPPTTVSTNSTAGYSTVALTGMSDAIPLHTLLVTITAAGTAGATILGVDLQNNAQAGVRVHNLGHAGSTTANWAAVNAANWQTGALTLTPNSFASLAFFQCVINDAGAYSSPVSATNQTIFAGNMTTVAGRFQAVWTLGDLVLVGDPDNGLVGTNIILLDQQVRDAAQAVGAGYLDLSLSWGPYAIANGHGMFGIGTNHPNILGGRVIAGSMLSMMMPDDQSIPGVNGSPFTLNFSPSGAQDQATMVWTADDVRRWTLYGSQNAETGSNNGSDWGLYRWADNGNLLGLVLQAKRSTGAISIPLMAYLTLGTLLNTGDTTPALSWTVNALNRWTAYGTLNAETGSNSGSDWALYNWDDTGTLIGQVIAIKRSTGAVTIPGQLNVGSVTDVAATIASLQAQINTLKADYDAHEHTAGTLTAPSGGGAVTGKTGTTDTPD